jgi:4-azaleucine resistance transporter AzlC
MDTPRSEFLLGVRHVAPLLLGIVPFGLISGVTAVSVGLSALETMGMSVIVLAGASQMVALELLQKGTFWLVILLTTFVLNLRHAMYSASLAPYFKKLSIGWRCLLAYPLVDELYAMTITRFTQHSEIENKHWYHMGIATAIMVVWHTSTIVGIVVGAQVPPELSLDFAIPLVFIVVLLPTIDGGPKVAAAATAGILAVLAWRLPWNLGLLIATCAGIAMGMVVESVQAKYRAGGQTHG